MRNIVAATDFSEIAENAVAYAAAIAKQINAKLILFNSFVIPFHASNTLLPADVIQRLMTENEIRLIEKAFTLSYAYDIEVDHETSFSYLEKDLKGLILDYEAELLVLGMPERTLEQDLWGNRTTGAIKRLKVPILAVPMGAKFEGSKRVLFACDMIQGVPQHIISRIKEVVTTLDGEMEIFSVDQKISEMDGLTYDLNEGLEGIHYYYKNVASNSVIQEIAKEIEEFRADLLIMIPKTYGFWASMVHRSKTRVMAAGLKIPLLSIPI
ncbi:universal stress protein [Pedobacter sp. MC2016-24]|uniref:universal stress protein n=1 Tax=Pedobacter sp. MC2016-24 TaxID=2780090 RepID=UPI001881FAE8|nr:universal stress protein [Pedobacter sp. MC2016-24]MBE9602214.1 universal stress protein [Pedobacter sp. MC2016-24]